MSVDIGNIKTVFVISVSVTILYIGGCEKSVQKGIKAKEPSIETDLGTTIGSLAEVFSSDVIRVSGYGLVGGLDGTGSSECPPNIRAYLEQYILSQSPGIDANKLISGRDTAVVLIEALMPTAVLKNQYFDVKVSALSGTQTTSLEGGWLYGSELKAAGSFGITTKVLAKAEGPVFIDTIAPLPADKKVGYILGGGRVLDEYKISLALRQPDYRNVSLICNKLNGRYGSGTAKAVSPSQIELKVPAKYKELKDRFISIVKATYLTETPETTKRRISRFIRQLAVSEDKYASEIALEAISNESLGKLFALLNLSDEEVRFRAARCILNLGSDEGLNTLRQIASDKNSAYRVEALEAITASASRKDAAAISRRLLRDNDFDIRLAAYEQLRKLDDISVTQKLIARSFYLEQITQTEHKSIFVSRSGRPRIVLFGAPIYCRDNIFVQSADGNITINAPSGQGYVSITRKHPEQPEIIAQLRSTFELGNIIETLCEEPAKKHSQKPGGLGVSYAEALALIKQMLDKGALEAEFRAGPLPKIDLIIK